MRKYMTLLLSLLVFFLTGEAVEAQKFRNGGLNGTLQTFVGNPEPTEPVSLFTTAGSGAHVIVSVCYSGPPVSVTTTDPDLSKLPKVIASGSDGSEFCSEFRPGLVLKPGVEVACSTTDTVGTQRCIVTVVVTE